MPKFVQSLKLTVFEKMFKLDARARLIVPNGTTTSDWMSGFYDKIQLGAVKSLSEYLSLSAPRLLISAHDQCVLFMHLFFNEYAYSSLAADNIFAFIYTNNENEPLVSLKPPTEGQGNVASFLLQSSSLFAIDPLLFILLAPGYFPLARYYFQFSEKINNGKGQYFSAAEFALIAFFDAYKPALVKFHSTYWSKENMKNLQESFGRDSADSSALVTDYSLPNVGAIANAVTNANTFIAYFFYFLNNAPQNAAAASACLRDLVQNLLKARFSLAQLFVSAANLLSIDDYTRVDWIGLDPNFFSADCFVHYLFPSISQTRSRLIDFIIARNDTVKNISIFDGQLINASTISNLNAQDFAGWKTYYGGANSLNSEEVYFNRICRVEQFYLFESTYLRGLYLLATSKLNMRIEQFGADDSGRLNVFVSFANWPPTTNRRLVTFFSHSLADHVTLRVIDIASSETLLDAPFVENRARLAFDCGSVQDASSPSDASLLVLPGTDNMIGAEDFWSSFMYRLEFGTRSNKPSYCVSDQSYWAYTISLLNTTGNSLADPLENDSTIMFRARSDYIISQRHFEQIDFLTKQYGNSVCAVNDTLLIDAMQTTWPGANLSSSSERYLRMTTSNRTPSALTSRETFSSLVQARPFLVFAKDGYTRPAAASMLNAGCCDVLDLRFFCDQVSNNGRLVYFELVFAVVDSSLNVAEYLAITTDCSIASLLDFKQTSSKTFKIAVFLYDIEPKEARTTCVLSVAHVVFLCQIQFDFSFGSSLSARNISADNFSNNFSNNISRTLTTAQQISAASNYIVYVSLVLSSAKSSVELRSGGESVLTIVQSATSNVVDCKVLLDGVPTDTWAHPMSALPLRIDILVTAFSSNYSSSRVYCVLFSGEQLLDKKVYTLKNSSSEKIFIQISDEKKNSNTRKIVFQVDGASHPTSYFLV